MEVDLVMASTVISLFLCLAAGESDSMVKKDTMPSTIGKTFKSSIDNSMVQPYAGYSNDKGLLGQEEYHDGPRPATDVPASTTPFSTSLYSTEASPSGGPSVAGVILVTLGVAFFMIGVSLYIVKKRGRRKVSYAYGHLIDQDL